MPRGMRVNCGELSSKAAIQAGFLSRIYPSVFSSESRNRNHRRGAAAVVPGDGKEIRSTKMWHGRKVCGDDTQSAHFDGSSDGAGVFTRGSSAAVEHLGATSSQAV
jgi:hypothetical protein